MKTKKLLVALMGLMMSVSAMAQVPKFYSDPIPYKPSYHFPGDGKDYLQVENATGYYTASTFLLGQPTANRPPVAKFVNFWDGVTATVMDDCHVPHYQMLGCDLNLRGKVNQIVIQFTVPMVADNMYITFTNKSNDIVEIPKGTTRIVYDIPSDYPGSPFTQYVYNRSMIGFEIFGKYPIPNQEIKVWNVYFYANGTSYRRNAPATSATKRAVNGKVVIERDGKQYNVLQTR